MKVETMICLDQQAAAEANRCLTCYEAPCRNNCPAGVDVSRFIYRLSTGDWRGAAQAIAADNPLGLLCGLVCPSEQLCRKNCNREKLDGAIDIAALQAYAMHQALSRGWTYGTGAGNKGRVAVVGGGPSGLAAAALLAQAGYALTVYEKEAKVGGVPQWEIPRYRLDKELWGQELNALLSAGMEVKTGVEVDGELARQLCLEYDAVYVACGLGGSLPGAAADCGPVWQAEDFLRRFNAGELDPQQMGGIVVVQGGGNTAIDAAISAKKLGAERVYLCYRRSQREMPAWKEELLEAVRAGVEFLWQQQIVGVETENGRLKAVVCAAVELGEADASGRRRPLVQESRKISLPADTLIAALGRGADRSLREAFAVPEAGGKVFFGGDLENGGATVVQAVAEAKQAVVAIKELLG